MSIDTHNMDLENFLDCERIFEKADNDNNGVITQEEFISLVMKTNCYVYYDPFVFNILYGLIDKDRNGTIDRDEMRKLFGLLRNKTEYEKLREVEDLKEYKNLKYVC